jgi:predicted dehydrogenase
MADPLRFGLIGCGQHGRLLLRALAEVSGTELAACADPNEDAVRAVAGDGVAGFADYREMLERSRLDAAIVVTAHGALAGAATAALESGRHVFCEKPMATSAAEARPVVAAARRAGVNLMVGYVLRFDASRRRMKELVDAGAVGEIAYLSAGKGGQRHTGWLAERAAGGGQLMWVGSHLVDQLNWLLGKRAERVFAEVEWRPDGGSDDTTVATIRFEDGVLAHLDCSQATHASYDYVEVVGSRGRIRSDWTPRSVMRVHSDVIPEYREPTTIDPISADRLPMYVTELREFVASVAERRPPAVTGEDGLRALEVLDAIVASAERGAPISLGDQAGTRARRES